MIKLGACVVAVAALASCGNKSGGSAGDKPRVAASIFPIYDLTRRVAGDRVEVMLVLPPGKSEHGYDPTPKEIARLEGAKLGIVVGLDMDGWAENILRGAGGAKIVRIGDKVKTMPIDVEPIGEEEGHDEHGEHHDGDEKGEHHDEHHHHEEVGAPDPHVWLDPDRMLGTVDVIAGELAAMDPGGKDVYAKNAEATKDQLKKLDAAIAARTKAWSKHTIVTFHGSMSYFAKRYGIRIAAVIEPLAGKEPTPAYITEVLAAIKRGNAAALFSEPQLDKAPAEMVAREAKIPLGELDPVGGISGRDSYEALLNWNTDQLEKLLK